MSDRILTYYGRYGESRRAGEEPEMSSTQASQSASSDRRCARLGRHRRVTADSADASTEARSEYARYVGRVAGLAVALGVGAAIASMPAVAFADTTGSSGSENSSPSSAAEASSSASSADSAVSDSSDSSDSTHEATSSPRGNSSFGSDSDAASDTAADTAADLDDTDLGAANPDDVAPDPHTSGRSERSSSQFDPPVVDSAADVAEVPGTERTSGDGPAVPVADPGEWAAAAYARREAGSVNNAAGNANKSGAAQTGESFVAGAPTSDAASAVGSPAVGSATSAKAGATWLFGNGTAEHPNGGVLLGSGFSWDANSCTGNTACVGGNAGLWGGNGGAGFNGGNGGSAGWFGNGGDGGAGLPGGNGGSGGRGGLISGKGGNGGAGGAALTAADVPGLGGNGGAGGLFGTDGRAGKDGAAFSSEPTPASNTVAPKLTFDFIYGTGSQYWSSAARDALQEAALSLSSYFVVESPVTLTFDVSGENAPRNSTLAWASSALSGSSTGYFATVVQGKILTGVDSNGNAADGQINFNFGPSWGLGNTVGNSQYDFQSTAMHELLHTFGLISNVDNAGSNTYRDWTQFDSFIVTSGDVKVIGSDFRWNNAYNPNLAGADGGLYFGGPNAVAAYGGLVPLYTPNPWGSGSSVSHLDDSTFTGGNAQLMNAFVKKGLGVRTVSPIELGILKDLGYTVGSPTQTYAALFITVLFIRRRRTS